MKESRIGWAVGALCAAAAVGLYFLEGPEGFLRPGSLSQPIVTALALAPLLPRMVRRVNARMPDSGVGAPFASLRTIPARDLAGKDAPEFLSAPFGVVRHPFDAFEQYVTRRAPEVRRWWATLLVSITVPLSAVLLSLWATRYSLAELFDGPRVPAVKALATLVLFEGAIGSLLAIFIAGLIARRPINFFNTARGIHGYTVLQGRPEKDFDGALRALRPGAFAGSRTGAPGLFFTAIADRDGLLLLGRGVRPHIVAAIHWSHVEWISGAEADRPGNRRTARTPSLITLAVRSHGTGVPLRFRLERAKLAGTDRAVVDASPGPAVVTALEGLRRACLARHAAAGEEGRPSQRFGHMLQHPWQPPASPGIEAEAAAYETNPRPRLRLAFAESLRRRLWGQVVIVPLLVLAALGGPGLLRFLGN